MKRLVFLVFFGFSIFAFSQDTITATVMVDGVVMPNVLVVNTTLNTNVSTNTDGFFSIKANVGNQLIIANKHIKGLTIVLQKKDFLKTNWVITPQRLPQELPEIKIDKNKQINARALGIIDPSTKSYTVAQRRLRTAGDFKAYHLLGLFLGALPISPILNKINGQTSRLKKEIITENKELQQAFLSSFYIDSFFTEELKIPADYVKGFQIFVLDDTIIQDAIQRKNRPQLTQQLQHLAIKYKTCCIVN